MARPPMLDRPWLSVSHHRGECRRATLPTLDRRAPNRPRACSRYRVGRAAATCSSPTSGGSPRSSLSRPSRGHGTRGHQPRQTTFRGGPYKAESWFHPPHRGTSQRTRPKQRPSCPQPGQPTGSTWCSRSPSTPQHRLHSRQKSFNSCSASSTIARSPDPQPGQPPVTASRCRSPQPASSNSRNVSMTTSVVGGEPSLGEQVTRRTSAERIGTVTRVCWLHRPPRGLGGPGHCGRTRGVLWPE